jgi:hypothetical protein
LFKKDTTDTDAAVTRRDQETRIADHSHSIDALQKRATRVQALVVGLQTNGPLPIVELVLPTSFEVLWSLEWSGQRLIVETRKVDDLGGGGHRKGAQLIPVLTDKVKVLFLDTKVPIQQSLLVVGERKKKKRRKPGTKPPGGEKKKTTLYVSINFRGHTQCRGKERSRELKRGQES